MKVNIPEKEKRYVFLLILCVLVITSTFYLLLYYLYSINAPLGCWSQHAIVTLEEGESIDSFISKLKEEGINISPSFFKLYLKITGKDRYLKAGDYRVSNNHSIRSLTDDIVRGRIALKTVIIFEGMDIFDIGKILDEKGIVKRDEFIRAATNPFILQKFGIPASSAEGYLFPETYCFSRGMPASKVIKVMVNTLRERLPKGIEEEAKRANLTLHQVITLASIIEKEAYKKREESTISAVYHNRLKRDIPLQADPTVLYALKLKSGINKITLTKRDLRTPSPYNTYLHHGLPPGPICNPGLASIKAALHPARVNYLYFVAKGDGTHYFSRTLREHNLAVWRYQLNKIPLRGNSYIGSSTLGRN